MSYVFSFEQPTLPESSSYSLTGAEMRMMVEVMREVGALREQGFGPNWTLQPDGVPQAKFQSTSNQLVTAEECGLIAERLRAGLASGKAQATLSFFDDAPRGQEGRRWVEAWADFNARAAAAGGYRVN